MSRTTPADTTPLTIAATQPTWVRWQIVAILVLYSFMTWFNRVSMSVAYDERIKDQYGISPAQMGWVYSTFLFAYMVCMTPGGWLIDRYGPWLSLVVMGFGSALFGALTAAAGYPALAPGGAILVLTLFFVIRSLMGALTAPVYPASSRVVLNWLPMTQRAGANGLIQGAAAVGIAFAFPLFGALIDWLDWPVAFLVSGTATALVALVWTMCGANDPAHHRWQHASQSKVSDLAPSTGDMDTGIVAVHRLPPVPITGPGPAAGLPLWRHRSLILLTITYGTIGYVEYLFFFWMHYYFEDVLHLGTVASRRYAAILTLAMAGGMVLGGWIADRLRALSGGRRHFAIVPVTGMCAGAVLLVLGILVQDVFWIVTLLALALAAVGATEAPVWTMATELGGRRGGTAAAICNTGGNAGGLIAPIVTPWVSGWISRQAGLDETTGWQLGIGLGSMIAIAGAVLWLWITPEPAEASLPSPHEVSTDTFD